MASDREYDALFNKYNVAVAKAQDLQEQLLTKQKQWTKRDKDFETTEKIARDLCESILAKESSEMVLGSSYSWSSLTINELLIKAKNTYKEYSEVRTNFLRRIMDESENRRMEIESLQEQIAIMKTSPGAMQITQDELKERIEKEKKEKEVTSLLPKKLKDGVEDGVIHIMMDETDVLDPTEEELYKRTAEKNAKVQITPKSIPVSENRKQYERKKERKEQALMAHTVNLKDYEEKMDAVCWLLLEVTGANGLSLYTDIETALFEKDSTVTSAKARVSMGVLCNMGLMRKECIKNPFKGTFYVYQFTDMGSRIYMNKYGKTPIPSEMDLIMAEHDNCTHGYGIKVVADVLRESGYYEDVCDKNRKNPISLGNGIAYIPDIICTDKAGNKSYIEYECGNHTQTNFNAKCNKMCKVTPVLNFIVPNRDAVDKIMRQVESWIKNRGGKSLKHVIIRVTSAVQIKDKDLSDNQNWKLVYEPGKKEAEPHTNF